MHNGNSVQQTGQCNTHNGDSLQQAGQLFMKDRDSVQPMPEESQMGFI